MDAARQCDIHDKHSRRKENMVVQPVDLTGPGVEDPIPAYLTGEGVVVIGPEEFDKWATKPRFRKGTARLTDLSSFITHTNRYKDEHTLVFANDDRAAFDLIEVKGMHRLACFEKAEVSDIDDIINRP